MYQEAAYIAYYFHWPVNDIFDLDHRFRRRWVKEISEINRKLNLGK
ncbi:MAG: DUF6760 family protein [Chloroflexota bacterium]